MGLKPYFAKKESMLEHIINPPNIITSASVFCGFYSLALISTNVSIDEDSLYKAALAIVFAGLFDGMDGRVARITHSESDFGIQYDSLADVISFGVAPAFLLYKWGLHSLGIYGIFISFFYIMSGAMRLARFNINTKKISSKWSQGITITESGGLVAMLIIAHHRLDWGTIPSFGIACITILLSCLMMSNIRFRTFKDIHINHRFILVLAISVISSAGLLYVYREISLILLLMPIIHITIGLIEEVFFFKKRQIDEYNEDDLKQSSNNAISTIYEDDL